MKYEIIKKQPVLVAILDAILNLGKRKRVGSSHPAKIQSIDQKLSKNAKKCLPGKTARFSLNMELGYRTTRRVSGKQ